MTQSPKLLGPPQDALYCRIAHADQSYICLCDVFYSRAAAHEKENVPLVSTMQEKEKKKKASCIQNEHVRHKRTMMGLEAVP